MRIETVFSGFNPHFHIMTDKPVGAIAFFTLNRHALPIQMPPARQPPFRNTHLYFLFWLHPFFTNHHPFTENLLFPEFAYQLSGCLIRIVSQRYLPCLSCMQGQPDGSRQNLHLCFAEVVFGSETLHKEPCHLLRRHN